MGCPVSGAPTLIQVEDLFEGAHQVVGVGFDAGEEGLHVLLPTGVDGQGLHGFAGAVEVFGDEIADEKAVGAEEQGVVVPAGLGRGPRASRARLRGGVGDTPRGGRGGR